VRFAGIDIGKWKCRAAIINREGTILDEFNFTNIHEGIQTLTSKLTLQDHTSLATHNPKGCLSLLPEFYESS